MRQLSATGRPALIRGRNIVTLCCNPDHHDSNPSLSIKRDGTKAICWACKWTGSWNKIAGLIGAERVDISTGDMLDSAIQSVAAFHQTPEAKPVQMPEAVPWEGPWRSAPEALLRRLDAGLWQDGTVERLLLPFWQQGRLMGGTGRVLTEPSRHPWATDQEWKRTIKGWYDQHPKWKNVYGSPVRSVLWPYDLIVGTPSIALVEGPSSCLRLLGKGIPCLAILGSQNWSPFKQTLLVPKGIRRVTLAFDGDDAGRDVTSRVRQSLTSSGFLVDSVDLPDGQDPGDCSDELVHQIHIKVGWDLS